MLTWQLVGQKSLLCNGEILDLACLKVGQALFFSTRENCKLKEKQRAVEHTAFITPIIHNEILRNLIMSVGTSEINDKLLEIKSLF